MQGIKHEVVFMYDPDHCKMTLDGELMIEEHDCSVSMRLEDESGNHERIVFDYKLKFPNVDRDIEHTIVYVNNAREFSLDVLYKQLTRTDPRTLLMHGEMMYKKDTCEFTMQVRTRQRALSFSIGGPIKLHKRTSTTSCCLLTAEEPGDYHQLGRQLPP